MASALWCCWLGGRKGIRPVKNRVVGCWCGCLSGARCRLVHMAQLMPLPLTVSCFSKIQIGFTFLVPAHLGRPGKRAVKRVCVCVTTKCNSLKQHKSKTGSHKINKPLTTCHSTDTGIRQPTWRQSSQQSTTSRWKRGLKVQQNSSITSDILLK